MHKTFIFDLDDTLIYNQHLYSLAQIEFAKFTSEALGPRCPNVQTLINHEVTVDIELVKKLGMRTNRFPTSFKETFLHFAAVMGQTGNGTAILAEQAYQIGERVFNPAHWEKTLVPGAEKTLDYLIGQGDELYLLTTGDETIQRKKVEHFGTNRWFQGRTTIVPIEKLTRIREIVSSKNPTTTWFVGNSVRSDILPALEAGIGAIYIPQETWMYESTHPPIPTSPRLIRLEEISEIEPRYATL